MGFLGRILKPLVENAFDRLQSEEMQERLKEQDKQVSKVQNLLPIQSIVNFGPMAALNTTFSTGLNVARAELGNELGRIFAPLLSDISAFTGQVRNLFEDFFFENRAGGLIGNVVGQGLGFIVGFVLPGGPLLWSQLFGEAGTFLGTIAQGGSLGPYDHPPIPGSPGDLTAPDDPNALPPHAQYYSDLLDQANNYVAPPVVRRQQVRIGGHRI